MAMQWFQPTALAIATSAASGSFEPRVLVAEFGDNYAQRSRDGINGNAGTWDLTFNNATQPERDYIVKFLEDRGGVEAFRWVAPDGSNTARKYLCPKWRIDPQPGRVFNITATFKQVFDND